MHLTYLDSNSWLIEVGEKQILLDPWLVGALVFRNQNWLFRGKKLSSRPIPENIDLILLSQGLEDHAHPETLQQLDRNIPVVASPNGAKVVQDLGYHQVKALAHGETFTLGGTVEIKAVPGSPIGPMLVENGYLIKELATNYTIYNEPHGYHSPSLQEVAPVDVILVPIIDLKVPLLGAVVKGQKSALQVCQRLKPQVIIPTTTGGDLEYEGWLTSLLSFEGNVAQFGSLLRENNLDTRVIEPQPGERFAVELEPRVVRA